MKMMMTSDDTILKIDSRYLQDIHLIEIESFKEHAYNLEEIKAMLEMPSGENYVYYIRGEPAGYVSFYVSKFACRVESIGVRPKFQRNGIGKKLMNIVEERCKLMGAKKIILETFEKNHKALEFYRSIGYEIIGTMENYYTIPFDGSRNAIRLKKKLLP